MIEKSTRIHIKNKQKILPARALHPLNRGEHLHEYLPIAKRQ